MKKLADYKGEEAIELWADLLDPMTNILSDPKMAKLMGSGKPPLLIAKGILKEHKTDAVEIMLAIDPEPIDGVNIVTRLVSVVLEFLNNEDIKGFFASAGQAQMVNASGGSATGSTKVAE